MTTGATGQLGLALPVQGELSGTWGDTVNNGITQYTNIAIAGTLTLTGDGAVTLANTTGDASASNITSTLAGAGTVTAQFAIVKVSGTTTTKVVTGPSYSKTYVVDNASSFAVTFKASGQTGVSIAAAEKVTVVFNGTDYIKLAGTIANAAGSNTQIQFNNGGLFGASSSLTWDGTTLSSTQVNITGQGTLRLQDTTGGEYVGLRSPSALGASYTLTFPADDGTSGQALITDGSGVLSWSTAASGDVYGPGSSTDNAVARFDSTTGKLLQNSVVLIGDTGAVTGVTDLTASGSVTLSGGTANGVAYLNGSKVVTSGSALTFDGTNVFTVGTSSTSGSNIVLNSGTTAGFGGAFKIQSGGTLKSQITTKTVVTGGGTDQSLWLGSEADNIYLSSAASTGNILFGQGPGYAFTEQMRLTSTGLGIGTSSPAVKLHVSGVSRFARSTDASQYLNLTLETGNAVYNAVGSINHVWQNAGTEHMRLDSSGNLGLGVTPSAWGGIFDVLQIGAGASYLGGRTDSVAGRQIWLGTNSYFNGTNWIYGVTQPAAQYYQNDGAHIWNTAPSGTAGNAITFTQAMTLDASGNLGVGATSPTNKVDILTADNTGLTVRSTNYSGSFGPSGLGGMALTTAGAYPLIFYINGAERARIDSSGNFYVATTASGGQSGFSVLKGGSGIETSIEIAHNFGTASGVKYSDFLYATGSIGSITQSGTTAVLYNTTSDQRLKENIVDADSASSLIDSLQVRQFDWKADGSHQRYGFIAQELVTVAPEAVHQPTDSEEMMAVDYSKLVPMLVKEIQSLRKRLADAGI